ncbi:MAG: amino acid ABC transporter permease [Oscillospiraceae bacterium]|nr:amino acid ABC transporter permease [Oscillospiraceae bacterium]
MTDLFNIKLVFTQIPQILAYLPVTLQLTAVAMVIGWGFGLVIALIKRRKIPVLSQLAAIFVSLIRGTPIIVQLYIAYFGIPIALQYINYYQGTSFNINGIPAIVFAMIALGLNQSAFDSEVIRAAIASVNKGEIEAGKSLGMSGFQVLRRVIFPEAMVVALPSLGNSLISLVKGTSLAFTCSVVEMTAEAKIIGGYNYRFFEAYCTLAIIYWAMTFLIEKIFYLLERKFSVPEKAPKLQPFDTAQEVNMV